LSPWFEASQLKIRLQLLFQLAHLDLLFNGYLPANASSMVKGDCKKRTMIQQRVKWQAKKQLYVKNSVAQERVATQDPPRSGLVLLPEVVTSSRRWRMLMPPPVPTALHDW
jgi:hypothetical protein